MTGSEKRAIGHEKSMRGEGMSKYCICVAQLLGNQTYSLRWPNCVQIICRRHTNDQK